MKLKILLSVVLLMTVPAAWAQGLDLLGVHNFSNGCPACHTPHGNSVRDLTASRFFPPGTAGNPPIPQGFTWTAASANDPISANVFLWNRGISPVTYTTWDGGTISSASVTSAQNAVVHTLMCMTCHDNSMYSQFMTRANWGFPAVVDTLAGYASPPSYGNHIGITPGTVSGGAITWGNGNLANSHPVHSVYAIQTVNGEGQTVTSTGPGLWQVTINSDNSVAFADSSIAHPAKLYAEGGNAYVECTTCHDPHRQTKYAYSNGGSWVVGAENSTVRFLRGAYSSPAAGAGNTTQDGLMNATFCRGCHYNKTQQFVINGGRPQ
jgi:hypothetical protein